MREVVLARGRGVTLVDDADYERISAFGRWSLVEGKYRFRTHRYAYCYKNGGNHALHRFLMEPAQGMVVDHINGDGLDNQRGNLRVCTHMQNCANNRRHRAGLSSQFAGVHWNKQYQKWAVVVGPLFVGVFADEVEAARASDAARRKVYGEFARMNFPRDDSAA